MAYRRPDQYSYVLGMITAFCECVAGEILSRCKECGLTYNDAVSMIAERLNELIDMPRIN